MKSFPCPFSLSTPCCTAPEACWNCSGYLKGRLAHEIWKKNSRTKYLQHPTTYIKNPLPCKKSDPSWNTFWNTKHIETPVFASLSFFSGPNFLTRSFMTTAASVQTSASLSNVQSPKALHLFYISQLRNIAILFSQHQLAFTVPLLGSHA